MKRSIYLAVGILFSALFYSCELLPDLNPNTSEGADILVRVENRLVADVRIASNFNKLRFQDFDLDITNDGNVDIRFEEHSTCTSTSRIIDFSSGTFQVNALLYNAYCQQISCEPGLAFDPTFENSTNSGLTIGQWIGLGNYAKLSDGGAGSGLCSVNSPVYTDHVFPIGLKYLMIKQIINGNTHYGWLEFQNNINRTAGTGQCILKRVALAQQPGYVLRAGQTE
jgi:hypothetical protein